MFPSVDSMPVLAELVSGQEEHRHSREQGIYLKLPKNIDMPLRLTVVNCNLMVDKWRTAYPANVLHLYVFFFLGDIQQETSRNYDIDCNTAGPTRVSRHRGIEFFSCISKYAPKIRLPK